jgi:multiple sugar transport system ATP-binding protein
MGTVTLKDVHKAYGTTTIVERLNLDFPDGSFTVLVGPSGCGKSTTLRMIAGLESVTSGTIDINDADVTLLEPRDRNIAMVFQNYALYPHLSVLENIAFPLRATKTNRVQARERAQEIAESLGLGHLTHRKPKDLSGGQQQRVAIGRAIIREPAVFLFDEPLSNLDAKLRVETRSELLAIQRRLGITAIYVTHDQEEAMTLSDRMVVMRDGKVAQVGTPGEVYASPNSVFVATFVGSPKMNILPGTLASGTFTSEVGASWPLPSTHSGAVLVGLRPEDVLVSLDPEGHATIEQIELLGPRAVVTLALGDTTLVSVVEAGPLAVLSRGARVSLGFVPGAAHLFDATTEERH